MDKPTPPAGPNPSQPLWPEDSGADSGLGATGVFGAVTPASSSDPFAPAPAAWPQPEPKAPVPVPWQQPAPQPLAEPVVHKVVLGGGAAESSPELLDRMRRAPVDRPSAAAPPLPAPPLQDQQQAPEGGAGFTQLLRSVQSEQPHPPAAPPQAPPAQNTGFTSLLRSLNQPEAPPNPSTFAARPAPPISPVAPEEQGGFTQLLRSVHEPGTPSAPPSGWSDRPSQGPGPAANPPGAANAPGSAGTFTQMFGTFGGAGANQPMPPSSPRPAGSAPGGSGSSFTQMFATEPQAGAPETPFQQERRPVGGSLDYGAIPSAAAPAAPRRDPFASSPSAEAPYTPPAPPAGSVGITRLIQMLDEPSRGSAPRMEDPLPPPPAPKPAQQVGWTQAFSSPGSSNEPLAPPAKAPDWSAPPPPPATPGPSEYTRILDASRARELSMQGGQASSAAPPPQSAPPPPAPRPSFNPSSMSTPNIPGYGGIPQPGSFVQPMTPQVPSYYPPQVPGMQGQMGSMPQVPGMYVPQPPVITPPQPPTIQPPQPGAGKLQQYVPLLLVLIIVLLVVLIVTVIFLMKH